MILNLFDIPNSRDTFPFKNLSNFLNILTADVSKNTVTLLKKDTW